jgi:uracil-DNA glycosylase family 4
MIVSHDTLSLLEAETTRCRRCPRLVEHREMVAREKRRAYLDWDYWGKPVPGFGDPTARLVLVGLAPGAHGSNRTGRPFTGDASGDFLYPALHRAGFASRPEAISRDDGLTLTDLFITAVVRCAPPGNKPSRDELATCHPYLVRELRLLEGARVYLATGAVAWTGLLRALPEIGIQVPGPPRPAFGHGAEVALPGGRWLVGTYHPSRQNTQTGRLTRSMFDAVFRKVRRHMDAR